MIYAIKVSLFHHDTDERFLIEIDDAANTKRCQLLPFIKNDDKKIYLLYDLKYTEEDCLRYCYSKGYSWEEDGIDLYRILDRVSCWCCANKNLKELRAYHKYLPTYWNKLKDLQRKTERPFRNNKESIFDLEERFKKESEVKDE